MHRLATGLVSAGLAATALSPAAAGAQTPATTATGPAPAPAAVVPDTAPATTTPAPNPSGPRIDPTSPLDLDEPEQPHAVEDPSMPRTPPAKPSKPKAAEPDPEPAPGSQGNGAGAAAPTTAGPGDASLAAIPTVGRAGVPGYFIDSFRIPVFLLPIYQAAGTEYGVRWEILAAINEIETDYGRNLNVSTAGATGWMQFMPATWAGYGVDANRDGRADPYNPVDSIFAAARYLQAAGAQTDLRRAIFAYNHAGWYVSSVLDRAQRLAALPADLVAALTGLANGRSPALGHTRAVTRHKPGSRTLKLSVTHGARIVAVSDARVVRVGRSARLGRFIQLRDLFGNTYTYGRLSQISRRFPVLRPAPAATAGASAAGPRQAPAPTMPATAGSQTATPAVAVAPPAAPTAGPPAASSIEQPAAAAATAPPPAPLAERTLDDRAAAGLRALPAARVAGPLPVLDWAAQARRMGIGVPVAEPARPRPAAPIGPSLYDRRLLGSVAASRVLYRPLREGSRVVAGTILGHAKRSSGARLSFEIRPAGRSAARIDPAPIVAGWKLLQASSRGAAGLGTTSQPSVGQVMLLAKDALQRLVLANPRIAIYPCGREDVAAGRIDRRVLATLQMLAMSGLSPTVSALQCGHGRLTSSGRVSEHSSGNAVDISAINGTAILGNQGPGSIADTAIRRLLTLQGAMQPHQIISLMRYAGATNTLALADHADHIHVGFSPLHAPGSPAARLFDGVLEPKAWQRLVDRLATIDNPRVATAPSAAATLAAPTTP